MKDRLVIKGITIKKLLKIATEIGRMPVIPLNRKLKKET